MAQNKFSWPLINDNISVQDKKVMADFILNTNRFTNGPKVKMFEEEWSKWLGVKYSVMVGSGAAANYITTSIVRELKGQTGEIIVPPIGWVSDVSSVINTGFTPVFVDVSLDTMAISYENIKNAINENTKAIVLVHVLGFNGINDKLIKLAKEHDLILIEDCCESHGATYKDQKIYEYARMFRSHGMTREASSETQKKFTRSDINPLFTFAVPGYNMRSTELNAVLGMEQITRLDYNIQHRCNNLNVWIKNLDNSLYFVDFDLEGSSNYALPLILNKNTDMSKVCAILEEEKVEYRLGTAGGGNQARQPYLERYDFKISGELQVSNYIHDYGLYLGNHPELKEQQIINLCRRLNNV